jgi:TonB family protein
MTPAAQSNVDREPSGKLPLAEPEPPLFGYEFSLATQARVGDDQLAVGFGATSVLDVASILVGLAARIDSYELARGGEPTPALEFAAIGGVSVSKAMRSACTAGQPGRGFRPRRWRLQTYAAQLHPLPMHRRNSSRGCAWARASTSGRALSFEPSSTSIHEPGVLQQTRAAREGGSPPEAGSVGDASDGHSSGVALERANWSCPWPSEANAEQLNEQTVVIRVLVNAVGKVESAEIVSDAGHGFGAAAIACALRTRFAPARDARGNAIRAQSPPIRVRFTR